MDSIKKRFERARRTLGELKVSQAVRKDRAIIGGAIPEGEEKAQSAWDKLGNGEWPEPDEMAALEIVIRLLRPAPLSHGGVLDDLPSDPDHKIFPDELKDQWSSFRTKIGPQ